MKMAKFIGTLKEYEKYIGPRIRNTVNNITIKERQKRQGICEFCGKKAELQSAHKEGKERKSIILEALKKYSNASFLNIDIEKCEKEIIELHEPINNTFYFLCAECHRKYDNNEGKITKSQNDSTENFVTKTEMNNNINDKGKNNIRNGGEIEFLPDRISFEKVLKKTRKANRKIIYFDGREKEDIWIANNFSASSSVIKNIRSGCLRNWKRKGIKKVIFEVKDI
jgi:hypothetical protein